MFSSLIALVLLGQVPEPGIMDTFVGTGKKGFTGDGGQAKAATLNQPFHVEMDSKGNLYIAEAENHCIRKVNLKTGVITTVAGNGKKGYTGDGGPATEATFNEPYAVLVDQNHDDLYIVDRLNAAIRKVTAKTGIVTTIAGNGTKGASGDGGPGTKAQLREPNDICFDGKGGLYIADVADWRIRRLELGSGMISTFAGSGRPAGFVKGKFDRSKNGDGEMAALAVLIGPRALCRDGQGNLIVCEREGSCIRKIDRAGIITTIAGDGTYGDKGDGGDAKKAQFKGPKAIRASQNGHLYIVDTENHSIRKIDARTNVVTTVAGGKKGDGGDDGPATQAGMDRPHGCFVDGHNILYIADSNNHRIRRVRLP